MGSQEVIVPQEIHKRLNELKQTTYKDVYVVDADYKPITWYRAEGEKKEDYVSLVTRLKCLITVVGCNPFV